MINVFKDFTLNILIIFSPLLFYPYILRTRNRPALYRTLLFLIFGIAIAVTMYMPVVIHGLSYDFRSILLAAGSLYGGSLVSIGLYAVLLFVRYIQEAPNGWVYGMAILPTLAMTLGAIQWGRSLTGARKMLLAAVLCTMIKLVTFGVYLFILGELELLLDQPGTLTLTYAIQAIILVVLMSMIDFLHRYHHMQEEVWKSEKIKIVSEMAASVAHEIRNPLTTVRGFIQLFGIDNLDKQRRDYYQRICLEELDRAQMIISDYLALAKPDPETIETIPLNEEIVYLSNVLLTYAHFNNIQINAVEADEEILIVGDRHKFRQALVNIGKNAIEAMTHGGTLELRAYTMKDEAALYISDTGVGMTPAQVRRLGTPYYSTKEKGTGLGTMVSFGILKKMNGKIDVTSELGKGTQYTITIPKA